MFTERENIIAPEYTNAQWVINITSFPLNYDELWQNPEGNEIRLPSQKYSKTNTSIENEYTLQIRNVSLDDAGSYPFIVEIPRSNIGPRLLNLSLTVRGMCAQSTNLLTKMLLLTHFFILPFQLHQK